MTLFEAIFAPRHDEHGKARTAGLPIRRLPFPERVTVPLAQHIGKPARTCVRIGQPVARGELIAEADGFVSIPHHAPVSGTVEALPLLTMADGRRTPAIAIRTDPSSLQCRLPLPPVVDPLTLTPDALAAAVQATGLVGLGGAAFPTHVKMSPPREARLDTLLVNGCECEPFLTADHRVMVEHTAALMAGIRYAMHALGVHRALIGVEDDKPAALAAMAAQLPADRSIQCRVLPTRYPQGAEKMLIRSVLQREVPSGKLPADIGVVVNNVGTLTMLGELLPRRAGLIERVVTVSGPGVQQAGNYLIPLGTRIGDVLRHAGMAPGDMEVILGGPMMGISAPSLDVPVTKGLSGILVFPAGSLPVRERRSCIRCGQCLDACPMGLNPSLLGQLAAKQEYEQSARHGVLDCIECGACTQGCPSGIPLLQYNRISKSVLRQRRPS